MYFESAAAVWHMEGHGPYVWAAYGITALVIILMLVMPLLRSRQMSRAIHTDERRRDLAEGRTSEEGQHAPEA